MPERTTLDGTPFRIGSPDLIVAAVELEGGAVLRLTASFYVGRPAQADRQHRVPRRRRVARARQLPGLRRDGRGRRLRQGIRAGPARPAGLSRNGLGSRRGGDGERDRRGPAAPGERRTGRPRRGHPRGARPRSIADGGSRIEITSTFAPPCLCPGRTMGPCRKAIARLRSPPAYQTSPGRSSQLIWAARSSGGVVGVSRTMM